MSIKASAFVMPVAASRCGTDMFCRVSGVHTHLEADKGEGGVRYD